MLLTIFETEKNKTYFLYIKVIKACIDRMRLNQSTYTYRQKKAARKN